MGKRILDRFIMKSIIFVIFSLSFGCATTPTEHEKFMGEGFQSSLPQQGTRVVVWGNHSGVVSRTMGWLHEHHIRAVDPSWIEKGLNDPGFAQRTRAEQKAQVLTAAQSVGAPLVLFAQVNDSQLGRKFDLMSLSRQRLKIIGVDIRGMNAETGDVVFGAKAWNTEPLVESEQIVQDLTTFALQKAWNEPDRALPLQQEVVEQKLPQEEVNVVTSNPEEITPSSVDPQPEIGELVSPEEEPFQQEVVQQEEVVVVIPSSEEIAPASEEPQLEIVEPLSSVEEPSLGLQVASGALSVFYTPVKIAYAGLGGLMGGLAYLVTAGNEHAAQSIWDASLRGTYWLNAKHLQGEEAILFKGEPSSIDPIHQARVEGTVGGVIE
jgi:hypothetical protein